MLIEMAKAEIRGGKKYRNIKGTVTFRQTSRGDRKSVV